MRAFRIPEVCSRTGLGRTSVYAAIKSGALVAHKYGRRTIILAADLEAFLTKLPTTRVTALHRTGDPSDA